MAIRISQSTAGLAICVAVVLGHADARAETCAPPSPACHLKNGQDLLPTDPRRAAAELLASFRLDERTDTLELYATALTLDRRYALALETWKRIIVFRDSELDAAKETARTATGRKLAAARKAIDRAQLQSEQAAAAIIKLWPEVGRVRIRFAGGEPLAVSRDGVEVDASRDVVVNAGRDELVFTRKDGGVERVVVQVAPGAVATIDAPSIAVAKPAAPERPVKPSPPPPPADSAEPAVEVEGEADTDAVPEDPGDVLETTQVAPRSPAMSRIGLGLVAGAVVAGGLAGGFGYLASRDHDRSRDSGCSADGQCPFGPAADLADRSNDRARIAQITAITSGALLATGVTLWLVGRSKTRRAAPAVAVTIAPSSAALSWRF